VAVERTPRVEERTDRGDGRAPDADLEAAVDVDDGKDGMTAP
jgi:hypothetical protein